MSSPLVYGVPKLRTCALHDEVARVQVQAGSRLEEVLAGRDYEPLRATLRELRMFQTAERDEWLAVKPTEAAARWVLARLSDRAAPWPALAERALRALAHNTEQTQRALDVTAQNLDRYRMWVAVDKIGWEQRFFDVQGPFRRADVLAAELAPVTEMSEHNGWRVYECPPAAAGTVQIIWRDLSRRLMISEHDGRMVVCDIHPRLQRRPGEVADLLRLRRGEFDVHLLDRDMVAAWVAGQLEQQPVEVEHVRWPDVTRAPGIALAVGPLLSLSDQAPGALLLRSVRADQVDRVAWSLPREVGADVDYSDARALRRRVSQLLGTRVLPDDNEDLRLLLLEQAEQRASLFASLPEGTAAGWVHTEADAGRPDADGNVEALRARTLPSGFAHAGMAANPNRLHGRLRRQQLHQPLNPFTGR